MLNDRTPSMDGVYEPIDIAVLREALKIAAAKCRVHDALSGTVERRMAKIIIAAADAGFREPQKLARIAVDSVGVASEERHTA